MRATRLDYEPSVTPAWGYARAFTKPSDWINTSGVFEDEFMRAPHVQYADEVGYWFSDRDQIFVKYVSDAITFGMDLSRWPATFTNYVKAYFASRIIHKLPGGLEKIDYICHAKTGVLAKNLLIAKNKAAMTQPTTFPARGSWAMARHSGRMGGRVDGGNPNSLIG